MNDIKKASFSLDHFKVVEFSFVEPSGSNLMISFNPSAIYYKSERKMEIYLGFLAKEENDEVVIKADFKTVFKFEDELGYDEIPTYFHKNSIAISFPYLRAFISTLTLQANIKPVILPLFNLSDLESSLKENTTLFQ